MKKLAYLNELSIETIRDALDKLDTFENLKVNGLTADELTQIKSIDPELFDRIGEYIKSDRWNPTVGMWAKESEKISDVKLKRNMLYSRRYFMDNFGKDFVVFEGDTVYNSNFAKYAYASGFDACVIADLEKMCWLHSTDDSRLLACPAFDTVDVTDLSDDEIKSGEFATIEEAIEEIYNSHLDLEVVDCECDIVPNEYELELLEAEKILTANNEDKHEEIKEIWLEYFTGTQSNAADKLANGKAYDKDYIKFNYDDIGLCTFKFAEDGSGEKIVRIRETAGKEKQVSILINAIDVGFRFETTPYKSHTFRIDSDGFVTETLITE